MISSKSPNSSSFRMENQPCEGNQTCCYIVNYEGNISGWKFEVFRYKKKTGTYSLKITLNKRAVIISLTLISVIFLLFKLRTSHHKHISVYPNFLILAALTFLFVVVVYILGNPTSNSYAFLFTVSSSNSSEKIDFCQILYYLSLAAQWWLQIAVVVFMFQKVRMQFEMWRFK